MNDESPKAATEIRLRHHARVAFHEVGSERAIGLVALANHLQQAAGEHAERLGLGMERMAAEGLAWVLSRQRLCIRHWPGCRESLAIETWPSLVSGPLFHREFRVLDGAGREIVLATSAWALFDLASRKSVAAPDWIAASLELDPTRAATFEGRTVPGLRDATWEQRVLPRWSDLDINRHVNNAQLLGWCLETLPRKWLAAGRLTEIDAQFRSECNLDDSVSSRAGEIEPGLCLHSLVHAADGKELLRARSRWRT